VSGGSLKLGWVYVKLGRRRASRWLTRIVVRLLVGFFTLPDKSRICITSGDDDQRNTVRKAYPLVLVKLSFTKIQYTFWVRRIYDDPGS
jgi:hypothetical protein